MLREHPSIVLLFKGIILSLLKTRTTSSFSPATSRVVVGFLILASQSHYVPGQLEPFLTMLLLKLKSIDSTFSLQSISNIHVVITIWKHIKISLQTVLGLLTAS